MYRMKMQHEKYEAEMLIARALCEMLIPHIESRTGKRVRKRKGNVSDIQKLVHEEYSYDDMITVIDWAIETWSEDQVVPMLLFSLKDFHCNLMEARNYKFKRERK